MFAVNDIVTCKRNGERVTGVVTRVNSSEYVQILCEDGKTYSAVYTGYLKKIGKTVDIASLMAEIGFAGKK